MLAYSAIAHAGYLLAAFAGVSNQNGLSETGIAAAAFYIAAYAAMNVGIFAVVTLVAGYEEQLSLIDDYRGLVYRSPLLGSLLIFFLISLIGVPFTGGFFGKFYAFSAAVGGGAVWLAIIGLLNSGLAAAYYLRLVVVAAQRPLPDDNPDPNIALRIPLAPRPAVGAAVIAALFLAVAATLVLGIIPGAVLDSAQSAAHTLQAPPQTAVPAVADPGSLIQH
jgi:NADH-quinone oxidoreductase subunit N